MSAQLEKTTENNKTFLVYKINDNDVIDQMSVEMLQINEIQHILPVSFAQIGEERYLKYDITSKISLTDAIKYPISKERLLAIYDGVFSGVLSIDDFMIPSVSLLMNCDDIYFDEFNEYIYLISFPVNINQGTQTDLEEFTRSLANKVQLKANDEYIIGKILNRLNQTQSFSVVEFKNFIKTLMNEKSATPQQSNKKSEPCDVIPSSKTPQQQTMNQSQSNEQESSKSQQKESTQLHKAPNSIPNQQCGLNIPGKSNAQMNIPGKTPAKNSNVVQPEKKGQFNTQPHNPDETHISLFYLLQHYNAENAALYKKQKEAKKNGSAKNNNMSLPNQNLQSQQVVQDQSYTPYVEQREPKKRNFGDTKVLNGKNKKKKTTVLNGKTAPVQNAKKRVILVRERTNERISITKVPFKLGASEDGDVDYIIEGNTNISQTHAIIGYEVSGYTIVDDYSTNGTYLNGNPLSPDKYMLLNPGDYIRMADEDFKFEVI